MVAAVTQAAAGLESLACLLSRGSRRMEGSRNVGAALSCVKTRQLELKEN